MFGIVGAIIGVVATFVLVQVVSLDSLEQMLALVGVTVLGYIVASRMIA